MEHIANRPQLPARVRLNPQRTAVLRSHRNRKRNTNPGTSLLKLEGVDDSAAAQWYAGKRVACMYNRRHKTWWDKRLIVAQTSTVPSAPSRAPRSASSGARSPGLTATRALSAPSSGRTSLPSPSVPPSASCFTLLRYNFGHTLGMRRTVDDERWSG